MNRLTISYSVLIASFILLSINISDLDLDDLSNNRYSGIVSNILLIISMFYNIREIKNRK